MATVVTLKPSDYAQRMLWLDGAPFSVKSVPFMVPILNCASERMILMTARQIGKSTTLSAKLLTKLTSIPHRRGLYVAPRSDQVVQFSKDRLSHMIAYSPMIQNAFIDSTVQQQVKAKEFLNGSMMFLRSCYHTADGARGISANDISIDEIQDIILDNIPVIEECAARKASRQISYCGTPKTNDNAIQKIWDNSTQNYWAIKCKCCNHWNVPLDMANLGPDYLICTRCGGRLYAMEGIYVSKYPNASVTGFHVSQCMIYGNPGTGLEWGRIMEKLHDPLYGMGKFINECLGFSYDVGARLITEAELRACCDDTQLELTLDRKSEWGIVNVCAGVDWGVLGGNTHTVVVIGGICTDGKLRVFFARKFPVDQDPTTQVDEICDIINRAGCSIVAADRGGGHVSNAFLRKKLTWAKVHEIEYKAKVTAGMQYSTKSFTSILATKYYISNTDLPEFRSRLVFPIETNLVSVLAQIGVFSLTEEASSVPGFIVVPIKTATIPSVSARPRAQFSLAAATLVTPTLYLSGKCVADMCDTCHTRAEQKISDKRQCPNYTENIKLGCLLMGLTGVEQEGPVEEDLSNPHFFLDRNGEVRILITRGDLENAAV